MSKRESISVSFTPEQAKFLAECVASGRYQSTSEVVREGLRLLQDREEKRKLELEWVRERIAEAEADFARGDVVDGPTFFQEWEEEMQAREATERDRE